MPRQDRLLYAFAAVGGNALGRAMELWLLFFYLGDDDGDPPRRASAGAIALVLVAIRLVEAFDDPYIGHLSDRTRSRLGRRIPYVLLGTPFTALAFVFIWTPPDAGVSAANAAYLCVVLWGFYLFSTLATAPHEALLPEIAGTHLERMSISVWQVVFGVVGAALALVASGPLIDRWGFVAMATVMAGASVVARAAGIVAAWRHAPRGHSRIERIAHGAWGSVAACLRNRQFAYFLPSFVLYQLGTQLILGVLPFLVGAVLLREDTGNVVALLTGVAILFLVAALPAVFVAVNRRSKRAVYAGGMLLAAGYFPLMAAIGWLPALPSVAQAVLYAAPLGIAIAPAQALPLAIVADICDFDRLRSGRQIEATFYSTLHTVEKTASALAPGLLALLLTLGRTAGDPLGVRLVGPIAGVLVLVGYVAFRRYELPDHVTESNMAALQAR